MAINPNPYYRDQELDEALEIDPGSIEALAKFNEAPAGHSLTGTPGQWAWEKPPVYTVPEDAVDFIMEKLQPEEAQERFLRLMHAGVPIETITNTIAFGGFTEGLWSVDVAEMLKVPMELMLLYFHRILKIAKNKLKYLMKLFLVSWLIVDLICMKEFKKVFAY
jgi:hypothetical protein